ncbi:MAG: alpha-galactosidase [Elusimicrobia bacterium]|nr:alpha-galactosidase [Elusimicrobiota bacterium]MDE2426594.1 alpha-galactosidase [Elusimicrobiota bacterium]
MLRFAYCGAWPESQHSKCGLERFDGSTALESWWIAALHWQKTGATLVGGVHATERFVTRFRLDESGFHCMQYAEGSAVRPGRPLRSDPVWIGFSSRGGHVLLEDYARSSGLRMRAIRARRVQAGWGSWEAFQDGFTVHDIRRELEEVSKDPVLRERLDFFEIDHGWEERIAPRRPECDWDPHPDHRSNWDDLLKSIHRSKRVAGIWIAPFAVNAGSRCLTRHPSLLVQDSFGGPKRVGGKGRGYCIDPGIAAARRRIRTLVAKFRDGGIAYFKADYLRCLLCPDPDDREDGLESPRRYRGGKTRVEAYRYGLRVLRGSASRAARFLACGAPLGASVGFADSARVGSDIRPYWSDGQSGLRESVRNIAASYFLHKRWWINDPDDLIVFPNKNEFLFWATAIALSGGTVTVSARLAELAENQRSIIHGLLPPYGKAARPLELLDDPDPRTWVLPVKVRGTAWHLIGLFNWDARARALPLRGAWEAVGGGSDVLLWDVWRRRPSGYLARGASLRVPGHGVRLLCARRLSGVPQLIATDLHFTCGAVELEVGGWEPAKSAFRLRLSKAFSARQGSAYIFLPSDFHARRAAIEDGAVAFGGGKIIKAPLAAPGLDVQFKARR